MIMSEETNDRSAQSQQSAQIDGVDYQHLLEIVNYKQRQQLQEVGHKLLHVWTWICLSMLQVFSSIKFALLYAYVGFFVIIKIVRLRAVLREILHAERLSSTSKLLAQDCLANSNISEIPMSTTSMPMAMPYPIGYSQQQRMITSLSATGKGPSFRQ
jgi:hypothetical protein